MKIRMVWMLSAWLFLAGAAGAQVIDLEDLTLDADSFWNGSDGSGGFTSGGAHFGNNHTQWGWDGFAYSNMTDTTTAGYGNQYSAIAGAGAAGSSTYAVAYIGYTTPPRVTFPETRVVTGAYVTNGTYPYLSMREGDAFAKQFGGETGTDPDWFKLTITGKDTQGGITGSVDFYLADYRSDIPGQDYIVDEWTWVDLTSLASVRALEFSLSSSDIGEWGMNTPGYFCMDNLNGDPPGGITGSVQTGITGLTTPVAGASITIVETGNRTATNDTGQFTFNGLPPGTYTLRVGASPFGNEQVPDVVVASGQDTPVPPVFLTVPVCPLPGDANNNTLLDLADAIYVLQVISGSRGPATP